MNARKPPPDPPEYQLVCRFVDQSESYVLGFEAGRLAQRMQQGESPINNFTPIHAKNEEQLRLLAEAFGYEADIRHLDPPHGEWASLYLAKPAPKKPGRHLRSV